MKRLVVFAKQVLPLVVIATVAYFFVVALQRNWENLSGVSISPNGATVGSILLFTLAVVVSGLLWGMLLERLAMKQVGTAESVRIHCASWLLKYVPGQAGSIVNKLAWGSKNGFSKKVITNSFLYENVLMVLAGVILASPILFLFQERLQGDISVLLPLLIVVPMLIVTYKPVFYRLLNLVLRVARRKPFAQTDFLSTKDLIRFLGLYCVPRLLNGIGFVLLASSVVFIEPTQYIGIGAVYILAGIVGMLAVFVPSGLGVREAVIALFLSQYFGAEQAIILALLARFYATIADVGVFGIYFVLNHGKLRQQ